MLSLPRLRDDERGVSVVVSAVLVFSLLTVTVAIYANTVVRDQVGHAEGNHLRRVSTSLTQVTTEIQSAITLDRQGDFAARIDLGSSSLPFLSVVESTGSLQLEDDGFFTSFRCPVASLLARDGSAGPGSTYAALGGAPTTFGSIYALELKISGYTFGSGNDAATLTVSSGGNGFATLVLTLEGPTKSIRVTTRDSVGRTVVDQVIATNLPSPLSTHVVNALEPIYGFAALLQDAQGPFSLATTSTTTAIQMYVVYWTTDGMIGVVGDGRLLIPVFQRGISPLSVVYRSSNQELIEQTYALQGGAIVLSQYNGEHLVAPPLSITKSGANQLLRYSIVNLTGAGHVAGTHPATLAARVAAPTQSILRCTGIEVVLQTQYPLAWSTAWSEELRAAGLGTTSVVATGNLVTVTLTGTWYVVVSEADVTVRVS